MGTRRVVLSSVVCPAVLYFSTFSHKGEDFQNGKKNVVERETCVVLFLQLLYEAFFSLRRTVSYINTNVHIWVCILN
jgi:hypothetical protein